MTADWSRSESQGTAGAPYLHCLPGAHAHTKGVGADHFHPGGCVAVKQGRVVAAHASVVDQDVNASILPPLHNDAWQGDDLCFLRQWASDCQGLVCSLQQAASYTFLSRSVSMTALERYFRIQGVCSVE